MKLIRRLVVCAATVGLAIAFGGGVAAARPAGPSTCAGGTLGSGTYTGLVVSGTCTIPDGAAVTINGNVILAPNAKLNAVTMASVRINGNVLVGRGATFGLGCTPETGVPTCTGTTDDVVRGNIVGDHALTMYLDGDTVYGNVVIVGGGPGVTFDPYVNLAIKDNVFYGNVVITGWQGAWWGYIRNVQHGNVVLTNNLSANPDSAEVVHSTITGSLVCLGNSPAAQFGDAGEGAPPDYLWNHVRGAAVGECRSLVAPG
jgi:hypothetical protein